jgi:predicted amidohydrolase YtcJ
MKMGITRSFDPSNPETVFGPEERVSLEQRIASVTRNGAFAAKLEDRLGSLEVGKLADVVALDRDLFEIAPERVGEAKILFYPLQRDGRSTGRRSCNRSGRRFP